MMSTQAIILTVAGVYLCVLLGIGFWAKGRATKASDFLVAGGKVGLLMSSCRLSPTCNVRRDGAVFNRRDRIQRRFCCNRVETKKIFCDGAYCF